MDSRILAQLGDYADGQYGQITAEQAQTVGTDLTELAAAGFAEAVIDGVWRLRAGGHHNHPRLYAAWLRLAPTTAAWRRDLPTTGVVSHASALRLYSAGDEAGTRPEFTAPVPLAAVAGAAVQVHVADLPDEDWQALTGLPVTTPARTLVDVAVRLDNDELARIIDTIIAAGHTTSTRLQRDVPALLHRLTPDRAEHGQLARLIAELTD